MGRQPPEAHGVVAPSELVGRTFELRFGAVDATPDLHEVGAIAARVDGVAEEGSPPSPRIQGEVLGPGVMAGLRVTLTLRYEGETLEQALAGRAVGVTVVFEAEGGRAVAGGLGTMAFTAA